MFSSGVGATFVRHDQPHSRVALRQLDIELRRNTRVTISARRGSGMTVSLLQARLDPADMNATSKAAFQSLPDPKTAAADSTVGNRP